MRVIWGSLMCVFLNGSVCDSSQLIIVTSMEQRETKKASPFKTLQMQNRNLRNIKISSGEPHSNLAPAKKYTLGEISKKLSAHRLTDARNRSLPKCLYDPTRSVTNKKRHLSIKSNDYPNAHHPTLNPRTRLDDRPSLPHHRHISSVFTPLPRKNTTSSKKKQSRVDRVATQNSNYQPIQPYFHAYETKQRHFGDLDLTVLIQEDAEGSQDPVSLQAIFMEALMHLNSYCMGKNHPQLQNSPQLCPNASNESTKAGKKTKLTKALQLLQNIHKNVGDRSMKTLLFLGVCHYQLGEYNQCIMEIQRVLETVGNLSNLKLSACEFVISQSSDYSQFYFILSDAYLKLKNYLCAIRTMELWDQDSMLKLSEKKKCSSSQNYSFLDYEDYDSTVDKKFSQRRESRVKNESALNTFTMEPQVKKPKTAFKGYLMWARTNVFIKNYENAVFYYEKCREIKPEDIECSLELSSIHYHQGQELFKAHEVLNSIAAKLIRLRRPKSDIDYVQFQIAVLKIEEKQYTEAYRILESISTSTLQSEVCFYCGMIYLITQTNTEFSKALILRDKTAFVPGDWIEKAILKFSEAIRFNTSLSYSLKSYHSLLLLLILKKDYYGAEYWVDRMKKNFVPSKGEARDSNGEGKNGDMNLLKDLGSNCIHLFISIQDLQKLVEGILYMLKVEVKKGLELLEEIQGFNCISKSIEQSWVQLQVFIIIHQFRYYGEYIERKYMQALKHINEISNIESGCEKTTTTTNKLLIEAMLFIEEGMYPLALEKLSQAEKVYQAMLYEGLSNNSESLKLSNTNNTNNIILVKAICYVKLYFSVAESGDSDKEVILEAEELLLKCLLIEKENAELFYLLAAIHYELERYETSLKYIRQAIEFSDEHTIKHYFLKGNIKLCLGRYEDAIKEYTNAYIVYNDQHKQNQEQIPEDYPSTADATKAAMINEVNLNRAIAQLKLYYECLTSPNELLDNMSTTISNRERALDDLSTYFKNELQDTKDRNTKQLKLLWKNITLVLHTQAPDQLCKIIKTFEQQKITLVSDYEVMLTYYLAKELNNCLDMMDQIIINTKNSKKKRGETQKTAELQKKVEIELPKRLEFDRKCLSALKQSSKCDIESYENTLLQFLDLTDTQDGLTGPTCGEIFRWADLLFYTGVIYFQLGSYEDACCCFLEALQEKKNACALMTLGHYKFQFDEELPEELFENRIFTKEEIEYNIGISYLLDGKYEKALTYLTSFNQFVDLIDHLVTEKYEEIADNSQSENGLGLEINHSEDQAVEITPFPTMNRLCSIYSPHQLKSKSFRLSFCLPKVELPTLDIFSPQEIEPARIYKQKQEQNEVPSINLKSSIASVIDQISLLDIEMRPLAPWIRKTSKGVVFTDEICPESIDLKSNRNSQLDSSTIEKDKDSKSVKKALRAPNRYAQTQLGQT